MARIIKLWDECTPEGLQNFFYHIVAVELAWRGGEPADCLIDYFTIDKNHDGTPTNRIEYNPIFSKTCQGGSKSCTNSKCLVPNIAIECACPVRLFHKLLSKNITSSRLFLRPNRFWKFESDTWFDNIPVGKNTINMWTKSSTQAIGSDTMCKKISNHWNRSTVVSHLANKGIPEHQLIKITGHGSSNSIKLNINQERHDELINTMRGISSPLEINNPSTSANSSSNLTFTNCTFHNCSFK